MMNSRNRGIEGILKNVCGFSNNEIEIII